VTVDVEPQLCPLAHRVDPDRPRRSMLGSILCGGHFHQSRTALEELPGRYDELGIIAAPSGQPVSGSRSAEKPIPYREKAADLRYGVKQEPEEAPRREIELNGIRNTLVNWARIVSGERNVQLPVRPELVTFGPRCWQLHCIHQSCRRLSFEIERVQAFEHRTDVDLAAEFLRRHHDWSVQQDWAATYAEELRDLNEAAWDLLYARRRDSGTRLPCPADCGGLLRASFRDDEVQDDSLAPNALVCDKCALPVPPSQWRTLARGIKTKHSGDRVTEEIAVLWAEANGWRLTEVTLRQWATRGHVTRHRVAGRTLYDLDEIEKRLSQRVA
jgi:hypothetical protein